MSSKPIHQILIRPIMTEKSVSRTQVSDEQQRVQYMFVVALSATKIDIARAVEELFVKEKVKVACVRTMHVRGKQRRMSMRRGKRASVGTTPSWKKAIVTLTPDSPTLPLLEGA
ncbi:MAG TPA: 50S ribosomal protein L23 [Armatimonadota bacterium]